MDVEKSVEEAADAVKKNWVVFAIGALIFATWLLAADYKKSGAISQKTSKWPIIGAFFWKGTPYATATTTTTPTS